MSDIIDENLNEKLENSAETRGIKTSVPINGALQNRINRPVKIVSFVLVISGIMLLMAFIVHFFMNSDLYFEDIDRFGWWGFFGLFAIIFGISFLIRININVKQASKLEREQLYTFFQNYFEYSSVRNGETVGEGKFYYSDLYKVRENKEFFLLLPNSVTVYPVDKKTLTEEEIEELRRILPLKKKG